MSEQSGSGGDDQTAPPDLPYVDGRDISAEELRAEIEKESDPQVQRVEEVRDELAGVVDELGRRIEPRSWIGRISPAVKAGMFLAAGVLALLFLRRRRTSRHEQKA